MSHCVTRLLTTTGIPEPVPTPHRMSRLFQNCLRWDFHCDRSILHRISVCFDMSHHDTRVLFETGVPDSGLIPRRMSRLGQNNLRLFFLCNKTTLHQISMYFHMSHHNTRLLSVTGIPEPAPTPRRISGLGQNYLIWDFHYSKSTLHRIAVFFDMSRYNIRLLSKILSGAGSGNLPDGPPGVILWFLGHRGAKTVWYVSRKVYFQEARCRNRCVIEFLVFCPRPPVLWGPGEVANPDDSCPNQYHLF